MFSNFCSSWIFYLPKKTAKHLKRVLSHVFIDETLLEPARESNELSLIRNNVLFHLSWSDPSHPGKRCKPGKASDQLAKAR